MIYPADEMKFNGRIGTYFEAYMFATTDKHIARHVDFSDMEIVVMDGNDVHTFKGDDVNDAKGRKEALHFSNSVLREKEGIDINRNANKLNMCMIYVGLSDDGEQVLDNWHNEYLELKDAVCEFAKEHNKVVLMTTHFYQKASDGSNEMNAPHVHIIYKADRKYSLNEFLYGVCD